MVGDRHDQPVIFAPRDIPTDVPRPLKTTNLHKELAGTYFRIFRVGHSLMKYVVSIPIIKFPIKSPLHTTFSNYRKGQLSASVIYSAPLFAKNRLNGLSFHIVKLLGYI